MIPGCVIESIGVSAADLFGGNEPAYELALLFIRVANTWDDLIDRDCAVGDEEINQVFTDLLVMLPRNPFYRQYEAHLQPLVVSSIISYRLANRWERERDEHGLEIGHVLRYAPAQIVAMIVWLCRGWEASQAVMGDLMKALCDDRVDHYKAEVLGRGGRDAG